MRSSSDCIGPPGLRHRPDGYATTRIIGLTTDGSSHGKIESNQKQSPDANELLLTELREIYSGESQLSKVLPRLGKAVQSEKLEKCWTGGLSRVSGSLVRSKRVLRRWRRFPGARRISRKGSSAMHETTSGKSRPGRRWMRLSSVPFRRPS